MTQQDINTAVALSVKLYGREATIKALNKLYRDGLITMEQAIGLLDSLNQ